MGVFLCTTVKARLTAVPFLRKYKLIMSRRILFLFLTLSIFFSGWYYLASLPVKPVSSDKIEIIIQSGESLDQIINDLYQKKLIHSRVAAKINIIVRGVSKKIQAGYFYFSPSETLNSITSKLTSSNTKQVWITFPEGLRREEIAHMVSEKFFEENLQSNFNPQDFIHLTTNLEGRLFPDTYSFDLGVDAEKVAGRLNQEFEKNIELLEISSDQEEIIILASLLERESRKPEEMPLIAGIISKRIESGWPLQIDATIQYAISSNECLQLSCDWWPPLLSSDDLSVNSPYNSYLNQGLPPAPICNPGLMSLKSAANPEISDYWFYLHGLDGEIHFARTVGEHQRNVCLYLGKDC